MQAFASRVIVIFFFRFTLEFFDGTRRHTHRQRIVRDVLRHDRSRARPCPVPNLDRGNEHCVRADEDVLADLGGVFFLTIIIAGDRPRSDVGVGADGGIANV